MIEGHERTLLAAQGYTELGMYDDALAELDSLPEEVAQFAPVVEQRAAVLIQANRWKPALTASRALCRVAPDKSIGFIHAAFCLHALGRTSEARDTLLAGPQILHTESTFHYNLACYECTLGNLDLARLHLEKSFELDKKLRESAKTDPDLAALRGVARLSAKIQERLRQLANSARRRRVENRGRILRLLKPAKAGW